MENLIPVVLYELLVFCQTTLIMEFVSNGYKKVHGIFANLAKYFNSCKCCISGDTGAITHCWVSDILCQSIRKLFTSDCHHLGRNTFSNYIQKYTFQDHYKFLCQDHFLVPWFVFTMSRHVSIWLDHLMHWIHSVTMTKIRWNVTFSQVMPIVPALLPCDANCIINGIILFIRWRQSKQGVTWLFWSVYTSASITCHQWVCQWLHFVW